MMVYPHMCYTPLGTITDIDGKFTITNVPSSSKTY